MLAIRLLNNSAGALKHMVKHRLGQPASESILLARMKRGDQLQVASQIDLCSMCELWPRRFSPAVIFNRSKYRIECQATESDYHADAFETL